MINPSAFEGYTDIDGFIFKISLYSPLSAADPKDTHLEKKEIR